MNIFIKIFEFLNKIPLAVYGICLGGLSSLGFAPLNLWSISLVSFALFLRPLIFSQERFTSKFRYFTYGWWFGFGHFIVGLYWISIALLIDKKFIILFPIALLVLPALLAFIVGFICFIFSYFKHLSSIHKIIIFATIWILFEYARSSLFTGFPWNLIGHIWTGNIEILQSISLIGSYGLGWVTIIMSGCILLAIQKSYKIIYSAIFLCIFISLQTYGSHRLSLDEMQTKNSATKLMLVQPNIAQKDKWNSSLMQKNLQKLLASLDYSEEDYPDIIIWPETAITSYVNQDNMLLEHIGLKLKKGHLIAGGLGLINETVNYKTQQKRWNSIFVINSKGKIIEQYNKSHLVPFGEYIPWLKELGSKTLGSKILAFLAIIPENMGFSTGDGLRSLKVGSIPAFSPLICYEAIFPNQVVDQNDRPKWLLHLTNDAWYRKSSGPYQHFDIAKMRAIEEGLPLVRVANTGISGVVDPLGRIIISTDLEEEKNIIAYLPEPLIFNTFYSKHYNKLFYAFCFIFGLYVFYVILIYFRGRNGFVRA